VGLKLNRIKQLLVYADDVNLLGDCIDIIKITETSTNFSKEVGLEASTEKFKHILLSHHLMQGNIMT
jgi:hypothetical protein